MAKVIKKKAVLKSTIFNKAQFLRGAKKKETPKITIGKTTCIFLNFQS